jgi:uncharacterized membrane protein
MNLHVVVIHFPIAALTLYALLELVRWRKIAGLSYWFYLKAFLVIVGELGAIAAVVTGKILIQGFQGKLPKAIEMHERFAIMTAIAFGIIVLLYITAWLGRARSSPVPKVESFLAGWLMPLLALAGLILITITGGLGGAMVFGADVDPIASLVYKLFVE